jgi:O-methyltransferase
LTHKHYLGHHWTFRQKLNFLNSFDPVRLATIQLAIETLEKDKIKGTFAELGVFRGATSRFIHACAPDRTFYLFDTFSGFPEQDLQGKKDARFKDTSIQLLRKRLGNLHNIVLRPGYFPDTAKGLENERFSLVVLDADLYDPTLAGLKFFYPRLAAGGYLFIHDYNSNESEHAVSRAVAAFFKDKPELLLEIPDEGGSVVIRKPRNPHAIAPRGKQQEVRI